MSNVFDFLDGVVNVLVIDPDAAFCESTYQPLFTAVPCCTAEYTSSIDEALRLHLTSGRRYHVCITELGLGDQKFDEFHILDHYAQHCSIAVVTADGSAAKGARCIRSGAKWVFDKSADFDSREFYRIFSKMLLVNVINHRFDERLGDSLTNATKILFERNPASVTQWAEYMRITDRQLRNLWHGGSGFGAKQMLFLYECIKNALRYYEYRLFSEDQNAYPPEKYYKKQMSTYFNAHQEVLRFILS